MLSYNSEGAADGAAVSLYLCFECVDGVELDLIADPPDELECAVPAVVWHALIWGP